MIKYNGQDIADIKYNGSSIKRVMKDGVQIWPSDTEPLQIPTGITLREVFVTKPNIPTGIQLGEYEIEEPAINWDYFITHTVTTNTEVRAYLKDDVILPFTGGDDTQFGLKVNGSPVVFTNFGIHYAPGASYVTLRNPTDFLPTDVITFSYTAGADPIEGENTGTFAPDLVDQLVENTVEAPTYTYLLDDYPGAAAAYSLRKLRTGEVNAVEVRRDNDNATTNVLLYDDPSKSIDLLSTVEGGGTLGDWVGASSAYVVTWYDQSGNNNDLLQTTTANQPYLISNGNIYIKNGKTSLFFNGATDTMATASFTAYPQPLTRIAVATHTLLNNKYIIDGSALNRGIVGLANTSGNSRIYAGIISDYNNTIVVNDQNLYFASFNGASSELSVNSTALGAVDVGTHGLDKVTIGSGASQTSQFLTGYVQETVVYPSDQTTNQTAIEDNINSAYNIWVVTAEVDAQLIQADNDNVSDTVIEINGVRSSASDTAVANLIARNNTIITN